ncbi:hypothetical protein [Paenibacillus sp. QZ-Y1]|uniref:hypothetical protein n=1 Tax=Paenibacillus sp. QZ-Y1 TaxID=3414511 RepID=UPI003F798ABA
MKVKRKPTDRQAFTGDIVVVQDGTVERFLMLTEDNDQIENDKSILYFVDLQGGISYKHVITNGVRLKFEAGYSIEDVGMIIDVISGDEAELIIE